MLVIAGISALLVVGVHESAKVNNVIVAIKVAIVLVFIVAGLPFISTANWITAGNPAGAFIPPNVAPGEFGWSGIVRGAAVVFFAYIGFDAVSTASQEAKNPQRDMPIGILGSLAICTVLYVLVSFVITGIMPYDKLNVPDPIAVGVDAIGLKWLSPLHQARRRLRPDLGRSRLALGPAAHLLRHVARRIAAGRRRRHPSALPHALHHHYRHRRRCDGAGGAAALSASSASWSASARYSPSRSCAWASWCSATPSPTSSALSDAGRLVRRPGRRRLGRVSDVRPAGGYVAAPDAMARHRPRHLRLLRQAPQPRRSCRCSRDAAEVTCLARDARNLRAFERQVIHQPLGIEDEADDGAGDLVRVDRAAGATVMMAIDPSTPTFHPSVLRN